MNVEKQCQENFYTKYTFHQNHGQKNFMKWLNFWIIKSVFSMFSNEFALVCTELVLIGIWWIHSHFFQKWYYIYLLFNCNFVALARGLEVWTHSVLLLYTYFCPMNIFLLWPRYMNNVKLFDQKTCTKCILRISV